MDELKVGAFVLQHEDRRFVLVAADVVAVDASLTGEVAAAAGVERAELVLCASHTHSGPAGVVARLHPADVDRLDQILRSRLVTTAAEAIAMARAGLERVELLVGVAETEGIAANRNDPTASYDPRLTVVATRRRDGSLQVSIAPASVTGAIAPGESQAPVPGTPPESPAAADPDC